MIAISNKSARQTNVDAIFKSLPNHCATGACLTCAGWIHSDQYAPSLFRFVRDIGQELRPSSVINGLGKHPASQSLNVQIFDGDKTVSVHDFPRLFVMEIATLIANVMVEPLKKHYRFASSVRPALSSRYTPLQSSQFALGGMEPSRVVNHATVAQRRKAGESYINTDDTWTKGQRHNFALNGKQGEPPARFAFDSQGLNGSPQWSVHSQSHVSDFRESDSSVYRRGRSALSERNTVVPPGGSKEWIACLLTLFNAPKERTERKIYAFKYVLQRLGIDNRYVSAIYLYVPELGRLIFIGNRAAIQLPSVPSFLKRRIVKLAADRQLRLQRFRLSFTWIDPVSEGFDHAEPLYRDSAQEREQSNG